MTVKRKIQSLIEYANKTTKKSDADLTNCVKSLVDGYGGGGGDDDIVVSKFCTDEITDLSSDIATSVRAYAFHKNKNIETINLPNCETVGEYAFTYETVSGNKLREINLPSCTTIDNYAFYYCTKVTNANCPELVTLGQRGFTYMELLESINLPKIESIGNYAMQTCVSLKTLTLPKIKTIGANAFDGCNSLETLDLGEDLVSIGSNALKANLSLTALIIRANRVVTWGTTVAANNPNNANLKIYVPASLVDSYKTATNWTRLADKFTALEGSEFE